MSTFHVWGDGDFDWHGLDKVIDYLCDEYRNEIGEGLCLKEKYGTIRYEWLDYGNTYAMDFLVARVDDAIIRWPHLAGEIVSDLIPDLDDSSPYKIKFAKILKDLHGEQWT